MSITRRPLGLLALALIALQAGLWLSGDERPTAVLRITVALEVILAGSIVIRVGLALRRGRAASAAGDDWLDRFDRAVTSLFPPGIRVLASSEVRVFGTLLAWLVGRIRRSRPAGHSTTGGLVLTGWVFLFALSAPA